jgi:hypothetical protein
VGLLINGLSCLPASGNIKTTFKSRNVVGHNRSLPNVQSSGTRDQMT